MTETQKPATERPRHHAVGCRGDSSLVRNIEHGCGACAMLWRICHKHAPEFYRMSASAQSTILQAVLVLHPDLEPPRTVVPPETIVALADSLDRQVRPEQI